MKNFYTIFLSITLITVLTATVYAANNQGTGSQGTGQDTGTGTGIGQGTQGTGAMQPVQNQNQVQTQNMGEEQQLQVKTQEQQGTETGANGNAQGAKKGLSETRSSVAQQIQELLGTQSAAGGIGDQVRLWAKAQQESELKVQEHLTNIESKTGLTRSLFGPNYRSLNALKQEVNQNRVRVQQLEQLELKLTNQEDITNVQEMIELLNQENIALQEKIDLEEADDGVLGWLVKLFAK
ncbi:hypothetical protein A2380_03625 [candidate division WWE3 bacterium RIFOXYB1_FULL_43_24]|uniref:Uncharacterized protein n=2 Tax=Katanobacteria TaxID=422282 RepID=A0A0G1AXL1_UNCKA|nr:MAG: hypothetical protein UU92_C0006G0039 [candidate division WWE3 bacterium GW2011_GWA1_42_12]KKS34390.1 MAG: hypothetical protein UU97_C0011G0026 [candidate division WWE3 bacterium GW2011_GWD1_42_14]KKS38836.1 MAG: hypothetical protein UV00_C0005G0019 [candidate division WWE3 bacterium GW2011_GWF1_42_14]KKS40534.1 MAG: hypothetical protein UV03_C0005G0020 [candidate division WWE3 bacterium GW2011_GWE1_42_16]KKS66957.1 MAG: hypothetical protein UV35_C0005G0038 [candidate division WWE3 bacte